MLFCPQCANLLTISIDSGTNKIQCRTCPYQYSINQNHSNRSHRTTKEIDDVLGGPDAWNNVDKTEGSLIVPSPHPSSHSTARCPINSDHNQAYYLLIQIRSADEPSTAFYRCTEPTCAHTWREN